MTNQICTLLDYYLMDSIILYNYKTTEISVTIEASFKDDKLIIEGYDIGKRVEECWGDSDYEYSLTIQGNEVVKLYHLLQVKEGDRESLLKVVAGKFNTNSCFSDFRDFIDRNGIKSEGFSWT